MATVSSIKTKMTSDRYITATLDYVTKKFVELDKSEGEEIYKYYLSLTEKEHGSVTNEILNSDAAKGMAELENANLYFSPSYINVLKSHTKLTPKCFAMTAINCSEQNMVEEWKNVRKMWKQDKGILAHHFYQSFPKEDNISPELAHKIGVQWAERCFEGFQVCVVTHVGANFVHNHVVINSCNIATGKKWLDNKSSIKFLRNQSDLICATNNLNILDDDYKTSRDNVSVDSYHIEEHKKVASWKYPIVEALDIALKTAKTKEDFIRVMNQYGFDVKYRDTYITISDSKEHKVRTNTLARQFGEKYYKENIDKVLGVTVEGKYAPHDTRSKSIENVVNDATKKLRPYYGIGFEQKDGNNEFYAQLAKKQLDTSTRLDAEITTAAYQRKLAMRSMTSTAVFSTRSAKFAAKMFLYFSLSVKLTLLRAMKPLAKLNEKYKVFTKDKNEKIYSYKMYRNPVTSNKNKSPRVIGNINKNVLMQSLGENYAVKIDARLLPKLMNAPIYYSANILNDGRATVFIKKENKDKLQEILGTKILTDNKSAEQRKRDAQLSRQRKLEYDRNKSKYAELKEYEGRLRSDVVTGREVEFVKKSELVVSYSKIKNTEKYRLLYKAADAEKLYNEIYPDKSFVNSNIGAKDSSEVREIAQKCGTIPLYKMITGDELMKLRGSVDNIISAVYYKPDADKYNLVYLKTDKDKVDDILYYNDMVDERAFETASQIKSFAELIQKSNSQPMYLKNVSRNQIKAIVKSKVNVGYIKGRSDKYYLVYDKADQYKMNTILNKNRTTTFNQSPPYTPTM